MFSLSLNGYDRSADKTKPQDSGVAIGPEATRSLALTLLPPPTDATPCLRHMSMIEGGFLVIEDYVCLIATCKSTQYYFSKNVFWVQYARRNKIELPEGCVSAYPVVKQHRLGQTDALKKCLGSITGTYPRLISFIDCHKQKLDPTLFLPEFFEIAKDIIKSKKLSGDESFQLICCLTADIPNRSKYMELFSMLDPSTLSREECAILLPLVLRRSHQYEDPNFEVAKALIRAKPSIITSHLVDLCISHRFIELIDEILKNVPYLEEYPKIATFALECCYPDIVVNYMCGNVVPTKKQEEILEHACIRGYDEIVKIGLNKRWTIDGRFAAIALRHGSMAIFDMLMRQQIDDPNVQDEIYCMAAFMGHLEIIEKCRARGWTLTQETRNQCVLEASKNGHIDVVKYFLPINKTYRTLSLYEAALRGDLEMIACLRPALLDPERRADVLVGALRNGNSEIIERILKSGPYAVTENNRSRIINAAIQCRHVDIVTYCDPKKLSQDERSRALEIALKKKDLGMMNILLDLEPISLKIRGRLFDQACRVSSSEIIQRLSDEDTALFDKFHAYKNVAEFGRIDLLDALNIEMDGEDRSHILISVVIKSMVLEDDLLLYKNVYKKVESGGPICWQTLIYELVSKGINLKKFFEFFSSVPLKEIPALNEHIDYVRDYARKEIANEFGLKGSISPAHILARKADWEERLKRLEQLAKQ